MISQADIRPLFTKLLTEVFVETIPFKGALMSLFADKYVAAKEISIEVQRGTEFVAKDVVRGTEGNRNNFSRGSEKIFEPPFYREFTDATDFDLYDVAIGAEAGASVKAFARLAEQIGLRMGVLRNKIERAKELQCAEVLELGTVTTVFGQKIDFARKGTSIVDAGGGNYFANAIDPFPLFEAGCQFLRATGKSQDTVFDAIIGGQALTDLIANAKFNARQNLFHMALDMVTGPIRMSSGLNLHGIITAGSYKVRLWSYSNVYDTGDVSANNVVQGNFYWNPKKVVMLPANPMFKMVSAQVPQLVGPNGQPPVTGAYILKNFRDERLTADIFDIQTAPLALPVAVDQIYTFVGKG